MFFFLSFWSKGNIYTLFIVHLKERKFSFVVQMEECKFLLLTVLGKKNFSMIISIHVWNFYCNHLASYYLTCFHSYSLPCFFLAFWSRGNIIHTLFIVHKKKLRFYYTQVQYNWCVSKQNLFAISYLVVSTLWPISQSTFKQYCT